LNLISAGTHWVYFADGTVCRYVRKKIIYVEGMRKYKLIFDPSEEIKEMFNLKIGEEIDPVLGVVAREYDYYDVFVCRDDPGFSRIWIFTNFLGEATPLSEREAHYKEKIKASQRLSNTLRAGMAKVQEELRDALTNNKMWMRKQADIINEAVKVRGRPKTDEDDDITQGQ